jgi:hypothetical protein
MPCVARFRGVDLVTIAEVTARSPLQLEDGASMTVGAPDQSTGLAQGTPADPTHLPDVRFFPASTAHVPASRLPLESGVKAGKKAL